MKKTTTDPNLEGIKSLLASMQNLTHQAVQQYTPLVEALILSKTKDEYNIQHLLDGILDFCFDDKMLLLFKKLCRYYYYINPEATADYVHYYREMWDEDYTSPEHAALN